MHIQALGNTSQLSFIPPRACLGNVVIVAFQGCMHQAVIMQCNFDVESNQWRYQASPTVTPAAITVMFDRDDSKEWTGQSVERKSVSTLLKDQLITFLDQDIQAVIQGH